MDSQDNIVKTALELVSGSKGVFAADASPTTLGKRLSDMGISVSDEEGRRRYREVLFTAEGLGEFVGGVIMHDESIRQKDKNGVPFVERLRSQGIIPGIKVDRGPVDLPLFPGEKITEGLDGLRERLKEYHQMGARFTKWRAVFSITDKLPTRDGVIANAHALARFAALSQEAGMVPIVEPEVLMEGSHTLERCQEVTEMVGKTTFQVLQDSRINFAGMLYKPNMVLAGKDCTTQPDLTQVAKMTVDTLGKVVSVGVPGVVFLSGGQDEILATQRLNEINKISGSRPWRLTFSFERALENAVMKIWKGEDANVAEAQKSLVHRAKMNSLASVGKYNSEEDKF